VSAQPRFLERLARDGPIVADGGMGSLISNAVSQLRCPEEANIRAPETVLSIHLGFIRAGAELIETNTFGANRRKLRQLLLEDELEAINNAGVKLAREAREASGKSILIAGSIGPLADLGEFEYGDLAADFAEQASLLDARGVDVFMLETFFDLDELVTAIEAVRTVSSLPIVAMMTFDGDETLAGVPASVVGERLAPLDLAAIGANCGTGPQAALSALERLSGRGIPLAAKPNIGQAGRIGGRISYPHGTPDYFAEFAAHARALGARVIGGCCGTTGAQIAAIATALEEERPVTAPIVVHEPDLHPVATAAPGTTRLERAFEAGEWVISLELDPPTGANPEGMLAIAERCRTIEGVDFIDVNDTTKARARINSLMAAVAIERATGIETIPHVTPRDMSVTGIESLLLGAHAEGIRNVLAVTGDPPTGGGYASRAGVYEVDSIGICRIVSQLNAGVDWNGRAIDAPTAFHLGVALNPTSDDLDDELRRFEAKIEAGARFAMTQLLFDLEPLDRTLALLGGEWPIPVLVGIFYATSYGTALRMHNEVPGIVVQEHVLERLKAAGPAAPEVGLELARELMAAARERAHGIYVMPPFKQPDAAFALFD
jgi:methionine synthase I (cobalamin-dependent)/5,10-methylenetetrahydrofolate reductase